MSFRQMIGLIILSLGIVLIVFAFHSMGLIEKKHQPTQVTDSPISPTEHFPEKVVEPRPEILWIMIGGIAMILVGGCIAAWHRYR